MLLNSTLASKYLKESQYSKRAQAGIDLSVMKIQIINLNTNHLIGPYVRILQDKTYIPKELYEEILPLEEYGIGLNHEDERTKGWRLYEGIYSVTFNEGINIPKNMQAKITHRSSIYRVGNIIESPWWDAGFHCDNMNSTLIVNTPMFVEVNARLAQVVFWEMYETDNSYNGQWQGLSAPTK